MTGGRVNDLPLITSPLEGVKFSNWPTLSENFPII